MLKQYKVTINSKELWFVGDTTSDIFFKVPEPLTYNQAAAACAQKEQDFYGPEELWTAYTQEWLKGERAEEAEFIRGKDPNGCIS